MCPGCAEHAGICQCPDAGHREKELCEEGERHGRTRLENIVPKALLLSATEVNSSVDGCDCTEKRGFKTCWDSYI